MLKIYELTNTVKALDDYFIYKPALSLAWDTAYMSDHIAALVALEARLLQDVQDAYFEDTKKINCRENCRLLSLDALVQQTRYNEILASREEKINDNN